jgi:hypothetical protein
MRSAPLYFAKNFLGFSRWSFFFSSDNRSRSIAISAMPSFLKNAMMNSQRLPADSHPKKLLLHEKILPPLRNGRIIRDELMRVTQNNFLQSERIQGKAFFLSKVLFLQTKLPCKDYS